MLIYAEGRKYYLMSTSKVPHCRNLNIILLVIQVSGGLVYVIASFYLLHKS